MKLSFPTRRLPRRPNLEQLKRQAKELLDAYLAGDEGEILHKVRLGLRPEPIIGNPKQCGWVEGRDGDR